MPLPVCVIEDPSLPSTLLGVYHHAVPVHRLDCCNNLSTVCQTARLYLSGTPLLRLRGGVARRYPGFPPGTSLSLKKRDSLLAGGKDVLLPVVIQIGNPVIMKPVQAVVDNRQGPSVLCRITGNFQNHQADPITLRTIQRRNDQLLLAFLQYISPAHAVQPGLGGNGMDIPFILQRLAS